MPEETKKTTLLIASYLEPEYVQTVREVDPRLEVIYEPDLLPKPLYPADHYNSGTRTPEQEQRWRLLLSKAEILFDFDYSNLRELPDLAPRLRWIQASSAGIGQLVKRYQYDQRMPNTVFTTASGVHARPLAEFCVMAMLMHYKGALKMLTNQRHKRWERYAGTDLEGHVLGVIGLGKIGSEVARFARLLGMTVHGTNVIPVQGTVDYYYRPDHWHEMLPLLDILVLCVPHTPETEKMIGKRELAELKSGAYLINIARGAVVDEEALIDALRSGHLSGAALDVFDKEPLPPSSPLWEMENVLVSPHSASTSDRENRRLTELFCSNLRRYLQGQPLFNVLNPDLYY
jgi:phosphoglycerate dehydrogenase-like enzyme